MTRSGLKIFFSFSKPRCFFSSHRVEIRWKREKVKGAKRRDFFFESSASTVGVVVVVVDFHFRIQPTSTSIGSPNGILWNAQQQWVPPKRSSNTGRLKSRNFEASDLKMNVWLCGCGGLVVSVLTFYSKDPSLNPADCSNILSLPYHAFPQVSL